MQLTAIIEKKKLDKELEVHYRSGYLNSSTLFFLG